MNRTFHGLELAIVAPPNHGHQILTSALSAAGLHCQIHPFEGRALPPEPTGMLAQTDNWWISLLEFSRGQGYKGGVILPDSPKPSSDFWPKLYRSKIPIVFLHRADQIAARLESVPEGVTIELNPDGFRVRVTEYRLLAEQHLDWAKAHRGHELFFPITYEDMEVFGTEGHPEISRLARTLGLKPERVIPKESLPPRRDRASTISNWSQVSTVHGWQKEQSDYLETIMGTLIRTNEPNPLKT